MPSKIDYLESQQKRNEPHLLHELLDSLTAVVTLDLDLVATKMDKLVREDRRDLPYESVEKVKRGVG